MNSSAVLHELLGQSSWTPLPLFMNSSAGLHELLCCSSWTPQPFFMNFFSAGCKFHYRSQQNNFSGLEIYFRGTKIYFQGFEIYFQATKKVFIRGLENLMPQGWQFDAVRIWILCRGMIVWCREDLDLMPRDWPFDAVRIRIFCRGIGRFMLWGYGFDAAG